MAEGLWNTGRTNRSASTDEGRTPAITGSPRTLPPTRRKPRYDPASKLYTNRARVAWDELSWSPGQHAMARVRSPNPATRATANPLPESSAPKSRWATKSGTAINATPVAASIAADPITSVLCGHLVLPSQHSLRPLLEHLLNSLFYHLLVLVAVLVQSILRDPTPNE